jgi:hypothetical protein
MLTEHSAAQPIRTGVKLDPSSNQRQIDQDRVNQNLLLYGQFFVPRKSFPTGSPDRLDCLSPARKKSQPDSHSRNRIDFAHSETQSVYRKLPIFDPDS